MEELAVDPACNGDAAGLSQLFVQLTNELISIRNRYAKLFRNFIYSHKNFSCHRQNTFLSCFVVDFFCRSIRRTLAGNPFRRCAVFFPLWHARLIACFPGESIPWTVIQFGSFVFHPLTLQRTFFLHLLTILIVKFLWIKLICLAYSYCTIHMSLSQAGLQENIK